MMPPNFSSHLPKPAEYAAPRRNGWSADDLYLALSHAVRDRLMTRHLAYQDALRSQSCKAEALRRFGVEWIEKILDVEEEPGFGNGALGRLTACFLESLATLQIPATGCGIRYEFGIFDQIIRDGAQVEITDTWLKGGRPWEIVQPDKACRVGFGGSTRMERLAKGRLRVEWSPAEVVVGIPTMAHLAVVTAHHINGALANPLLDALLLDVLGPGWPAQPDALRQLEPLAEDGAFLERCAGAKRTCKLYLACLIEQRSGLVVDPASLFAVQVKRIHEVKQQHLNALAVIGNYLRIKAGDTGDLVPRTVIFGGKAAPGYVMAKLIIRFSNGIVAVINRDPACRGWLLVVYFENYNVKLSEKVYPAAGFSD